MFFRQLCGMRAPSSNSGNQSYAEIQLWQHRTLPMDHVTLKVVYGDEVEFISYGLKKIPNMHGKSMFKGVVQAHFMKDERSEKLVQGFKQLAPDSLEELDPEDRKKIPSDLKITGAELLPLLEKLPSQKQEQLIQKATPSKMVKLKGLDVKKMMAEIKTFKANEKLEWGPFVGTQFHPENTYNCASAIGKILKTGGIYNYIPSRFSLIIPLVFMLEFLTYKKDHHLSNLLWSYVLVAVGYGAWEGFVKSQSFFNSLARQGRDSISYLLGGRAITTLFSAVMSLFPNIDSPLFASLITMPEDVMDLAQQAKYGEDALLSKEAHEEIHPSTQLKFGNSFR